MRIRPHALVAALFFLSGVTGLMYEITWVRLFAVVFGNSTHAISVVVAVFMAGLAVGAFALGGRGDQRPLLLYAVIELGIAASSAVVPHAITWFEPSIAALYAPGFPSLARVTILRFSIASIAMIVPTALMGATLPIVSRYFVRETNDIGGKIGLLYGLNSVGAMVGCVLTGFYLIRSLGVTNSSYLASSINATIGALALFTVYASPSNPSHVGRVGYRARARHRSALPHMDAAPAPLRFAVLAALFASGFTAISYEVVWSRILGFVFQMGMSVYAFTIVLGVLLAGLGLGGLIYRYRGYSIHDSVGAFGIVQVLIGATVSVAVFLFSQLNSPHFLEISLQVSLNDFLKAAFLVLPPAVLMGIGFPLACTIIAKSPQTIGGAVGSAYAVNTLGCVLGPLTTGFLLVPLVGTEGVLKAMITVNVVTGLALVVIGGLRNEPRRMHLGWAVAALVALAVVDVSTTHTVLTLFNTRKEDVVYFREGPSDSLLATRLKDGIQLIVGGSIGAGSTPRYQRTDELLAYIPLLLHKAPQEVAIVGFGTGRTAGLYGGHSAVAHIDVVEIAQGALDSGRDVFAPFNQEVLSNPKVTTILDDGFNFMKHTGRRYDVVSLDPFSPRDPGSARLYTTDFLGSVKRKLKDGGIVVMWAYPSNVRQASFRLALKTFHAVFPQTTVWTSPVDHMFVFVATPEPLQIDVAELGRRLDMRPPQPQYPYHIKDAVAFLNLLFLDEAAVQQVATAEQRPAFTVDRPNLEFVYLTDRSPALDARWRYRMKSSVVPKLRNVPVDLADRLWTPDGSRTSGRRPDPMASIVAVSR